MRPVDCAAGRRDDQESISSLNWAWGLSSINAHREATNGDPLRHGPMIFATVSTITVRMPCVAHQNAFGLRSDRVSGSCRAGEAFAGRDSLTGFLGGGDQSSFRIVPRPRFLVNSELLLLPNTSR